VKAALDEQCDECPLLSKENAYKLLARTQIVPNVLAVVEGDAEGTALDSAMSEVLDGLNKHLRNCFEQSTYGKLPEEECALSRDLLQAVATQQEDGITSESKNIVTTSIPFNWVGKEWRQTSTKKVCRLILVGLMFNIPAEVLSLLEHNRDTDTLRAAYKMMNALFYMDLPKSIDIKRECVQWLLATDTVDRITAEEYELTCLRMTSLARYMSGAAVKAKDTQCEVVIVEFLDRAVDSALQAAMACWPPSSRFEEGDERIAVIHVCLWTLEEMFKGAEELGWYEDRICGIAEQVLACLSQHQEHPGSTQLQDTQNVCRNLLEKRRPQCSHPRFWVQV